ncbi:uncharacterized protein clmnb [Genypterus blacodes]|uniref:uncharacterized protein clmnb n=1 Tax=Genypterus blacodes TaxID=154954 RepID=UPI003F76AD12
MATQDKASQDADGRSVGEIRDQHTQHFQDEQTAAQKRTFTRWMNVFLQRREPPVEMCDLFTDIQDGRLLMALLEELTGCRLLYRFRSSSHRIFRLNNIAKALSFLDDRHVKLLGIDATAIVDGVPSVVLNLVWNIILYFQVKEVSGGLQRHLSSSLSSLSMSSFSSSSDISPLSSDVDSYSCNTLPSKGRKAARKPKYHGKAIKTLLQWVHRSTSKFGVEVHDFGKSWRSGLAFLALIKSLSPVLVDLRDSLSREPKENVQEAFMIAQHSLGIPPLLEPQDVICSSPDEQSIITYVSMFLRDQSDFHQDPKTQIEMRLNFPEIPTFGSYESISPGETLAQDQDAQTLLKGMGKSSEQLLWNRWSRRSSGELRPPRRTPEQTVATSQLNRFRFPSVFQPSSPSDIGRAGSEIRSWMEKSTSGIHQGNNRPGADEYHFSLSSEEGTYNLPALDSDEEEAYSYILDLNRDAFQSYHPSNRQVAKVEEETTEEMILNGHMTGESEQLGGSEGFNGDVGEPRGRSGSRSGSRSGTHNGEFGRKSEVRGQWKCESGGEGRSNEEVEDEKEREVRGQSEDGEEERRKDDSSAVAEEHLLALDNEEEEHLQNFKKDSKVSAANMKEDIRQGKDEEEEEEEEEDHAGESTNEDSVMMGMNEQEEGRPVMKTTSIPTERAWTPACSAPSQPYSEDGVILQPPAASCDASPLELAVLLALWILLYCYMILPQLNHCGLLHPEISLPRRARSLELSDVLR